MAQRPATVLDPAKLDLLRKALTVAPMMLDLTGLSMYPAIRPGDRSRVTAVDPSEIRLGDIILTTRDDRLYAHRVVDIRPAPPYEAREWIVKGDTLLWPDPPVHREDILGKVIAVERGGRVIDLGSPGRRRAARAMARLSGPYSRAFVRAMLVRRRLLAKLAYVPAWRSRRRARVGEVLVRPSTPGDVGGLAMMFGEQQALHTPMSAIDMESLTSQARQMVRGAKVAGSTLWLAEMEGFIAGHAVIGPLSEGGLGDTGWWVMSVYVKMTARGCGLAEKMVRAGMDEARQRGQTIIRYAAYENNRPSLNLAAKLGFVPDDGEEARRFVAYYHPAGERGPHLLVMKADPSALPIEAG